MKKTDGHPPHRRIQPGARRVPHRWKHGQTNRRSDSGRHRGRSARVKDRQGPGPPCGDHRGRRPRQSRGQFHRAAARRARPPADVAQDANNARARQDGVAGTWVNPDTGNRGTVTPRRTYRVQRGATTRYCREFQQTITVGGKTERAYGRACRQPDGSWKIVN